MTTETADGAAASHPDKHASGAMAREPITVDVQTMQTSRGPDYFVRFTCGDRSVTPHVFRERYKAEYEVAVYQWVFGIRVEEPDVLAYDETSYPNEAALSAISAPEAQREGLADRVGKLAGYHSERANLSKRDAKKAVRDRVPFHEQAKATLYEAAIALGSSVAREGLAGRLAEPEFGSLPWAFDLGYAWRGMLQGQTLEDSRAVSRTLGADIFNGLNIDGSDVPGFETSDIGICACKLAIKRALALHAPSQPIPQEGGRVPDGWSPISSAPLDEVVLVRTAHGRAVARWSVAKQAWFVVDDQGVYLKDFDGELAQVQPTHWAAPQPPLPSGAPDALAAGVLVEIEALEGTAAKVRNGASGDRVAAWIEMSVRGLRAAIAQAEAGASGTNDLKQAQAALERDRSQVAVTLGNLRGVMSGYAWLREAGRGSYAYDDDRYQQEFGGALDAMEQAIEPLRKIARDWSDCPKTTAEVHAARAASSPEPSRQGVEALRNAVADRTLEIIANFDDRTSPEDQPDMLLVTGEELVAAIGRAFDDYEERTALAQPQGAGPSERGV